MLHRVPHDPKKWGGTGLSVSMVPPPNAYDTSSTDDNSYEHRRHVTVYSSASNFHDNYSLRDSNKNN